MLMLKLLDLIVGLSFAVGLTLALYLSAILQSGEYYTFQDMAFVFTCILFSSFIFSVIFDAALNNNEKIWKLNYKIYFKFKELSEDEINDFRNEYLKHHKKKNLTIVREYFVDNYKNKTKSHIEVLKEFDNIEKNKELDKNRNLGFFKRRKINNILSGLDDDIYFAKYRAKYESKELLIENTSNVSNFFIGFISFVITVFSVINISIEIMSASLIAILIIFFIGILVFNISSYRRDCAYAVTEKEYFLSLFELMNSKENITTTEQS